MGVLGNVIDSVGLPSAIVLAVAVGAVVYAGCMWAFVFVARRLYCRAVARGRDMAQRTLGESAAELIDDECAVGICLAGGCGRIGARMGWAQETGHAAGPYT